jgi:PAS domain S-box-containing protein
MGVLLPPNNFTVFQTARTKDAAFTQTRLAMALIGAKALFMRFGAVCCRMCLLLLMSGSQYASAQSLAFAVGTNDSYTLSGAFFFLEDTSATLKLEDILEPRVQARFKPVAQGAASSNFGATDSAIWLRLKLETSTDTPRRWLLEVANPPLDRLDLYVPNSSGAFDHQAGGDSLPYSQRPVPHRNHVKPIELEAAAQTIIYLRVMSKGNVSASTTLWQPAALWREDQKSYSIFSLYFGLLIGLVLYNLLLFFSVRDYAYLIYVAFAAFVGLSQVANSGIAAQFLWPNSVWWNNVSINVAFGASGVFGTWFARSFLASRSKLPSLDWLLRLVMFMWLMTIIAVLSMPYKVGVLMVTTLALVAVATIVLAGAISIARDHPGAKYFGLAWGILLTGIVVLAMRNYGFLPTNVFTANALLIGSALEMVLLSFALADRINITRREKELAQAQVASEQAMVHALHQSQESYRSVIEHVAEGMVVVQNEHLVFVNFRATEILEATKAAIIEEGIISRIHADDRELLKARSKLQLAGQQVPERCEVRLVLPSGIVKWLEFGDNTVPWDGGKGLLIFFLDVTQRHNAEVETRAAIDRQQELNDLRSRFVAMTSHEFRTPLAAILSAQDLLKSYGERLPTEQKEELLGMIESGVNRMTGMLERVLLLGQVEAHMLEFKPRPLDLKVLCGDLVEDARKQQPDSQCTLSIAFPAEPIDGLYDEKLLRHIFGNLLSNALKYSPEGGEVWLKVYRRGKHTVFEVTDQGIGIPEGEMDHLFESFHRASNVGAIQGTGLGLAIVKQSVELHGGSIEARPLEGGGSCFTVLLT